MPLLPAANISKRGEVRYGLYTVFLVVPRLAVFWLTCVELIPVLGIVASNSSMMFDYRVVASRKLSRYSRCTAVMAH